MQHKELQ